MSADLMYCPNNSEHGKWLNYGRNCPQCPQTRFNVTGPKGAFTESFTQEQVALLCRMGFIEYQTTYHYGAGSMTHYNVASKGD